MYPSHEVAQWITHFFSYIPSGAFAYRRVIARNFPPALSVPLVMNQRFSKFTSCPSINLEIVRAVGSAQATSGTFAFRIRSTDPCIH
jgi:hypothetical protein